MSKNKKKMIAIALTLVIIISILGIIIGYNNSLKIGGVGLSEQIKKNEVTRIDVQMIVDGDYDNPSKEFSLEKHQIDKLLELIGDSSFTLTKPSHIMSFYDDITYELQGHSSSKHACFRMTSNGNELSFYVRSVGDDMERIDFFVSADSENWEEELEKVLFAKAP